jgi:SH3 domain-containing YSC84-like protein 1
MRKFLLVLLVAAAVSAAFGQTTTQSSGKPEDTSGVSNPPPAETVDPGTPETGEEPAQAPDQTPPATSATPPATSPASTGTATPAAPATSAPPATQQPAANAPASSSTSAGSTGSASTPSSDTGRPTDQEEPGKVGERVKAAATVLDEIESAPDSSIPEEVLGSAQCVAVVPSLLKGGFVLGARYGRGVASCRTAKGWSAPAFFTVKGGSVGLQIGGQAVDLIMLIMNDQGMKNLLSSKFQLGADASVAAGPVGRHAEGETDWKMRAEVLTYSRARGVFAGITLNGASITQDKDSTREFYGRMVPFRTSLTGQIPPPDPARPFLDVLSKWAKQASK